MGMVWKYLPLYSDLFKASIPYIKCMAPCEAELLNRLLCLEIDNDDDDGDDDDDDDGGDDDDDDDDGDDDDDDDGGDDDDDDDDV